MPPLGRVELARGMNIAGFEIPSTSPMFLAILAVHVPVGVIAVVTGVAAMLCDKRRGAHPRFGSVYFWSLGAIFVTSAGLAAMRWGEDYHLFILGAVSFNAALIGRAARRQRWSTPIDLHIIGMGVSYIVMLTAFYVDNGKNLPIWRNLPHLTLLPSGIGLPLIGRALGRYRKVVPCADGCHLTGLAESSKSDARRRLRGVSIGRKES